MKKSLIFSIIFFLIFACKNQKSKLENTNYKFEQKSYITDEIQHPDSIIGVIFLKNGNIIKNVNSNIPTESFKYYKIDSTTYQINIMYVDSKNAKPEVIVKMKGENIFVIEPTINNKSTREENCCLGPSLVVLKIKTDLKNPTFRN